MAGVKGKRYVTHNTSVMSHQYSWGSKGKEHELYGIIKEFEISSGRMVDHYKKCTGKSEAYIRKNLLGATDVWLTPEEVVKHGIADSVVETYYELLQRKMQERSMHLLMQMWVFRMFRM